MTTEPSTEMLRIDGVSKSFGATQALCDVSFSLQKGHVHALLGGNGSGKSTLIKILAGVQHADAGELTLAGRSYDLRSFTASQARAAGLRFVHQQTSTFADLTVAENLSIGHEFDTRLGRIRWRAVRRHASDVLERFGIRAHPDQMLGDLGPATATMVAIARALQDRESADSGVLVLDEPTASLPSAEVEILLDGLRRYAAAGHTIVYVTHRLEEVFALADHATLLRDGRVVDTVAPANLTHDRLVELMMGQAVDRVERLRDEREVGDVVFELRQVSAGPLRGVDLEVRAGEVLGIGGLLGSGRSTLLKVAFGLLPLEAGEMRMDGTPIAFRSVRDAMANGVAYVPEDRTSDAAFLDLSVRENLSLTAMRDYTRAGIIDQRAERRDTRALFDSFLIRAESDAAPLASLSGGNAQKVVLARWLRRDPRLLLLDEPTQGVDVGARAQIYELVLRRAAEGGAVLLVSSDFEELATVCDRVLLLQDGKVVAEATGDTIESDQLQRLAHAEVRR